MGENGKNNASARRTGIEYIKSLTVGKGQVPSWDDGKGALVDAKY